MKHYSSRILKSVALIYLCFPVLHIVLAAILFDIPANLCVRILLSPVYYIVAFWAMAVGYGLREMHRWVWYPFVMVNFLIAYENAILVHDYGESHHKIIAFGFSLALIAGLVYRVGREIRVPYFFPKIRWWESNPRYRLSAPVTLNRKNGDPLEAEILDLSMGGCFVKIRTELQQDESIGLNFQVFGHTISCNGTVVWRTQSTVTHPKGIGVKFGLLDKHQKRTLRVIERRLRKISAFYRRSRYLMNQEEFTKRLEELEAHGSQKHTGSTA